jgi:hypothetical protein
MLLGAMNAPVLGGPPCSSGLLPAMVDQPDVCRPPQPPTPRGAPGWAAAFLGPRPLFSNWESSGGWKQMTSSSRRAH